MDNILVRLVDLPCSVRGCVVKDDDYYTVLLNSRMSAEMQKKTYKHEIEHIDCEDFSCDLPIDYIESIRHR